MRNNEEKNMKTHEKMTNTKYEEIQFVRGSLDESFTWGKMNVHVYRLVLRIDK